MKKQHKNLEKKLKKIEKENRKPAWKKLKEIRKERNAGKKEHCFTPGFSSGINCSKPSYDVQLLSDGILVKGAQKKSAQASNSRRSEEEWPTKKRFIQEAPRNNRGHVRFSQKVTRSDREEPQKQTDHSRTSQGWQQLTPRRSVTQGFR